MESLPLFCWIYVIFQFFGRPGPLLARFGLDFGRFGPPFWKFLGCISEVSCGTSERRALLKRLSARSATKTSTKTFRLRLNRNACEIHVHLMLSITHPSFIFPAHSESNFISSTILSSPPLGGLVVVRFASLPASFRI